MTSDVLSRRALNRATLERQLLLQPSSLSPYDAVTHLVGLQAQEPSNPYVALWSRLHRFRHQDLSQLLADRRVVRIVVMRGTIHLVTVDDAVELRPLMQPVLDAELACQPQFREPLTGVDLAPVLAAARELLDVEALSGRQLQAALAERFPAHDAAALAYACRNHLPLVQVPPRGLWRESGQVACTTIDTFTGRHLAQNPSIDDAVLRYLAAFGPAAVADVASWSRLTGLREVVERLRPQLRSFKDERGRELLDLPDAPRPDPDTPSPPRFLPEYDNCLLSHADRSRFAYEGDTIGGFGAGPRPVKGTVLLDGAVRATWCHEVDQKHNRATLHLDHLGHLTRRATDTLTANGRKLLRFLEPDVAEREVRFHPIG